MAYDSQRIPIHINAAGAAATSAGGATAAVSTFGRVTVQSACVIKDFNVQIGATGDTGTSGSYVFVLQKSKAGTGAVVAIGTASAAATGNVAANSVIDGAVAGTARNLDAGDDVLLVSGAGTVLPVGSVTIAGADLSCADGDVDLY